MVVTKRGKGMWIFLQLYMWEAHLFLLCRILCPAFLCNSYELKKSEKKCDSRFITSNTVWTGRFMEQSVTPLLLHMYLNCNKAFWTGKSRGKHFFLSDPHCTGKSNKNYQMWTLRLLRQRSVGRSLNTRLMLDTVGIRILWGFWGKVILEHHIMFKTVCIDISGK